MEPKNGRERNVLAESNRGLAPSQIDAKLGLAPGEARATMVTLWARDKAKKERPKPPLRAM